MLVNVQLVSIVTSLLNANYKENLMTIKKLTFVLLTCFLPFLVTKGSRILEKKVNETQVSNTVFGHLK